MTTSTSSTGPCSTCAASCPFRSSCAWLANVLDSRGYPLANLADNLQTGAEVMRERVTSDHTTALADTLEAGAELVRGLGAPPS